jgi:hypothetical protein
LCVPTTANLAHRVFNNTGLGTGPSARKFTLYAKPNGYTRIGLRENLLTGSSVVFTLTGDGTVDATHSAGVCTASGGTITAVGDGWYKIEATFTISTTGGYGFGIYIVSPAYVSGDPGSPTFAGNGTSGIYLWGSDVRVSNDGVGLPAYQRIAAATDYDTTGFPIYLAFDGSDDSLATAAIDFSATDEMSVFAGVRVLGVATQGIVVEHSAIVGSNAGTFALSAPGSALNNFAFYSRGSIITAGGATASLAAPVTAVLFGSGDISNDATSIRVNGAAGSGGVADQGTGNYTSQITYIGSRAGSSLRFNGRLYSLIVRGKTSTADEITAAEAWVNSKTGAY